MLLQIFKSKKKGKLTPHCEMWMEYGDLPQFILEQEKLPTLAEFEKLSNKRQEKTLARARNALHIWTQKVSHLQST